MMLYKNSMLPFRNLVQIRYISTGQTTYPEESSCKIFNWKNKSISWENVIGSLVPQLAMWFTVNLFFPNRANWVASKNWKPINLLQFIRIFLEASSLVQIHYFLIK